MLTTLLKPNFFNTFFIKPSDELVKLTLLGLLFYSGIYYGGLYQKPESFFIGYLLFFATLFYVSYCIFANKKLSLRIILTAYLLIALWTIFNSPHPIVDTMPAFTEGPLKFLSGINPYASTYTRTYPNIEPNYYNHFPLSFIYPLPFVLIFHDPRFSLIFANFISAFIIYKLFNKKNRNMTIFFIAILFFLPRSFYMLEHMYLDQIVFAFYMIFIYFYSKQKKILYLFFLSLSCLIKQHLLLILPIFFSVKVNLLLLKKWRNSFFFLIPFLIPLYFILINPNAFLTNTLFGLTSSKITSPINISLTLPTFLKNIYSIPFNLVISSLCVFFLFFYFLTLKSRLSFTFKVGIILFSFNFFFHHAFFNSYYLVIQFFLLEIAFEYFEKVLS